MATKGLTACLYKDPSCWLVLVAGVPGLKMVRIFSSENFARRWLSGRHLPIKPDPIINKILRRYKKRQPVDWTFLDSSGLSVFQKNILRLAGNLKPGQTITYGELADRAGYPGASRAVGQALKRNPWPILVPCHRVVGKKDSGGYVAGRAFKRKLLNMEKTLKIEK